MRSDVSCAFIVSYAALLFGRAYWLGDPWSIPLKQLQSGALLLFTFFMISDPKTTPIRAPEELPCAAEPLSFEELRGLGVFWLTPGLPEIVANPTLGGARNVFVTRMHLRYDAEHFPEDLLLQETADRNNFQARYVLRHPWRGDRDCPATEEYRRVVLRRQEIEACQLADLTAWDLDEIRARMDFGAKTGGIEERWWQRIWRPLTIPEHHRNRLEIERLKSLGLPGNNRLGAINQRIEVDASTDQQASDEKLQPFTFALLPQQKLDACDFGSHTANHTRVNDDGRHVFGNLQ